MNKKPETRVILQKTTVNPPNAVEIATQQRVEIAKALSDVRRRNRIAAAGLVVSGLIILGGIGSFYFLRSEDQDPLSLKLQLPFAIVHNNKKDAQQPQNGPGGFETGRPGYGSEQNGTGHGPAGDAPVVR